jgi:hypothetical protein
VDRRWGGALVLVVAVIAALAGNARTKHLAGDAERGPVPGPPHVGDCLLESPGSVRWGTFDGDQSSADPPGGMAAYPSLRLGDCATRRFGEVAGVVADGSDRRRTYQEAWGDPTSPESTCSALIDAYLGTPQVSAAPPTWSPAPYTALVLVGPSDLQRADGQHWLGCVAAGVDGTGNPAAYTGSVRGTLRSLRFPSQLAECLERQPSTAGVTAVGCDRPHKAELLAIGYSDAKRAVDTDDADLGCADLARSMTGLADPAAVGWLRVRTLAVQLPPDPNTADSSTANPTQWYCTIEPVGDHVLTGPVLGLGDGPPPVR